MQIIHKDFRGEIGFNKIESPFVAVQIVAQALLNPWQLPGLVDLIHISGLTVANCQDESYRRIILETISRGKWLMVRDDPLSPLSNDTRGLYANITGLERGGGRFKKRGNT